MGASGQINWRIAVNPDPKEIDRAYGDLARALVDWRPAFKRLIPVVLQGTSSIFGSKGGALNEPWAPLSAAYAKRKQREGKGRVDLLRSGKLRRDLVSANGVLSMTPRRFVFGTQLPYARAVQFGQHRAVLGWTTTMESRAGDIMNAHAEQMVEQAAEKIDAAKSAAA